VVFQCLLALDRSIEVLNIKLILIKRNDFLKLFQSELKIKVGEKLDWEFTFDGKSMHVKLNKICQ
jgi:hypothetical protein